MLVDTSVWVDHLRRGNPELADRLEGGEVECHPFVVGELACGALRRRDEFLPLLDELPVVTLADHREALTLVTSRGLAGKGLGWIDVHLLASALLTPTRLWTLDRRLADQAEELGVVYEEP